MYSIGYFDIAFSSYLILNTMKGGEAQLRFSVVKETNTEFQQFMLTMIFTVALSNVWNLRKENFKSLTCQLKRQISVISNLF